MLDAYIIEELKKIEEEKRRQRDRERPQHSIHIEEELPEEPPKKEDDAMGYKITNSYL